VANSQSSRRARGSIKPLPSGALRVRVYTGYDPLSGRRHYLTETVPAGAKAWAVAEKARTRLLNQVDERRNPRTRATVDQLMDRYLEVLDVGEATRYAYQGYITNHIRPVLGGLPLARLDGEVLDSFYAGLRKCRKRCAGRAAIDHRTDGAHDCDHRCGPHVCWPLAASSIRQVHWILSGALKKAVRWRWLAHSPVDEAEPPAAPSPHPRPPSTADTARILTTAWKDPDWGAFIWLAVTTGARRGELCALRWNDVELTAGALSISRALARTTSGGLAEKDTKTHQHRRVALDSETVEVMVAHRERAAANAAVIGVQLLPNAFVFSRAPDSSSHLLPDSVSQRYGRLVGHLNINTTLHKLRHYSATELISAGVDIRTVAGRLGHGGGGTTTLKVYAAWVSEADQRAAATLASRLPRSARNGG
jgi:integrase